MAKADLHVHSIYSEYPSEWFLRRLGAKESYTEPEFIYSTAKRRGMDFVTITDHNRIEGALLLKERHPEDVFTGVEATTYFPEDGCEIHVLIYGLTPHEFDEIQRIRKDVYALRAYIKERKLAYSVSHPTYSANDKLSFKSLEKMILLFDIFEGINGGRNRMSNSVWTELLGGLEPSKIEDLYKKYLIEPFGSEPWVKSFTGGTDDHSGIYIGMTYTLADANRGCYFLERIRNKKSSPAGMHNDFASLVFTVYKGVYDHSKLSGQSLSRSFLGRITEMVFEKRPLGWRERAKLWRWRMTGKRKESSTHALFVDLINKFHKEQFTGTMQRLEAVYTKVAAIADEFLVKLLKTLDHDIRNVDIVKIIKNISSSLPSIFLSWPFLRAAKHLNSNRRLLEEIKSKAGVRTEKRILWCTDTLNDLNGVSVILQKIGWLSHEKRLGLKIVTALSEEEMTHRIPPGIMNLSYIYEFRLPQYESYVLKVPSLLRSLKDMHDFDPDEIYISTPGPVGLLGLLVAKHLNARCIGVYHTDFYLQAKEITGDENVAGILESYTRWFYSCMDEIKVPTIEYMKLLSLRGLRRDRMSLFKRGIDHKLFYPRMTGKRYIREQFGIKDGITILFAGRVSKDKNLDFLLEVYKELSEKRDGINLLIAGDGPALKELKKQAAGFDRVVFTGRLEYDVLPDVYSGAEIFAFPSATDTFGMVVLEAQSCGLPCIVTDEGGPKEIVIHGETGYVVRSGDYGLWKESFENMLGMLRHNRGMYEKMKERSRQNVIESATWDALIEDITGKIKAPEEPLRALQRPVIEELSLK